MRRNLTLLLGLTVSGLLTAAGFAADLGGRKDLGDVLIQNTPATHFIWTDNNWYTSGSSHTLRWTFDPQGDAYPYTLFVYRENIRTGERMYVSNNSLSAEVRDVLGNPSGSFQPNLFPAVRAMEVLSGPVPSDVGNYHYVAELRDVTGTRIVKKAWAKFNVVSSEVTLGGDGSDTEISSDTTWTADTVYRLRGQVFVNGGATLTIEPGTLVVASGQNAVVVVERGGRLHAAGTRALPIVMSCDAPIGQRTSGCWAGLIVLGAATQNLAAGATPLAEGVIPATRPEYGGTDDNDSSGVYRYLRVEFAGVDFSNEIQPNAFGFHGVGDGTSICYIQAHEGEDDGIEFFGGTANMHHFVSEGSKDDSVDSALGWRGIAQFGYIKQDSVEADSGYEGDGNENGFLNEPRNAPQFWNVTWVGDVEGSRGLRVRRGHLGAFVNNIVMGFGNDGYEPSDDQSGADVRSTIFWNNRGGMQTLADQIDAAGLAEVTSDPNNMSIAPLLRNTRLEGNPDPRPLDASAAGLIGMGVTPPAVVGDDCYCGPVTDPSASFIGGFGQDDNWLEEWTFFGPEDNYDDDPTNDTIE